MDNIGEYDIDIPNYANNEESWKNGFHYDRDDKLYEIGKMTDDHLLATIRYFKGHDTTPLEKEARRRGLLTS